jgi:tRNA(Ile)-lysidine synthase
VTRSTLNTNDFQIRARFRSAVRTAGVADGERLLVAVSGGCDSVTLLHLCLDEVRSRGWRISVGHVDHALRPDSAETARWVAELSESLSLPFFLAEIPPETWGAARGESLEAEARRLRRRLLRDLAREAEAAWVFLGHNLDDQAETVLLNLLRGTGLNGLRGMAGCRPPWIRPLLKVRRGDLRDYAARRPLAWREDPSNADPGFLRNRIRLRLLPLLESDFSPGAAKTLARTTDLLRPVHAFLEAETDRAYELLGHEDEEGIIRLERARLASYHQAIVEELIRRAFRLLRGSVRDLKRAHVDALIQALRSGQNGETPLPGGITATLDRQDLSFAHPRRTGDRGMTP